MRRGSRGGMRGLGSRHLQSPCARAHLLAPKEQLWGTAASGARGRGRSLGTQGCSSSEGTRPDRRHRHSSRQEPQPQEGCCKITSAASALRLPPGAVNNPTASLCPPGTAPRGRLAAFSPSGIPQRSPGGCSWSPAHHLGKNPLGLQMGTGSEGAAPQEHPRPVPISASSGTPSSIPHRTNPGFAHWEASNLLLEEAPRGPGCSATV